MRQAGLRIQEGGVIAIRWDNPNDYHSLPWRPLGRSAISRALFRSQLPAWQLECDPTIQSGRDEEQRPPPVARGAQSDCCDDETESDKNAYAHKDRNVSPFELRDEGANDPRNGSVLQHGRVSYDPKCLVRLERRFGHTTF